MSALREKLAIKVEGEPPGCLTFKPVRSFQEAGFPADVLSACANFKQPSPIQAQCWPIVLRGVHMWSCKLATLTRTQAAT